MKVLVWTTTHDGDTGRQIDSWEGDYIEAESREDAIAKEVKWEAELLEKEEGATDIHIDDDTVFYKLDGKELYRTVETEEGEKEMYYITDCITGVWCEEDGIESLEVALAECAKMNKKRKAEGGSDEFWMVIDETGKEYK